MSIEAMKLALDALTEYTSVVRAGSDPNKWNEVVDAGAPARKAVKALRTAIEQAEKQHKGEEHMSIEAMKMALAFVEGELTLPERECEPSWSDEYKAQMGELIAKLRAAIEQAEKQQFNPDWDAMAVMVEEQQRIAAENETLKRSLKRCLFQMQEAEKEQAEKQEPVAWGIANTRPTETRPLMMVMIDEPEPSHLVVPLYTAPPQRKEWQGLTDEEYEQLAEQHVTNCYFDTLTYAKTIEAKLKENNNG